MTLEEKIELLRAYSNEIAFGWNDSGCYWHFQWGPRGAGNMMDGFGQTFQALEAGTFPEAVDALLAHRGLDARRTK